MATDISALTREELAQKYVELQADAAAVFAKLLTSDAATPDRILTIDDMTRAMGVSRRWLFAHASKLPFITRVSRRSLTGSEAGMRKWLANRARRV